MMNWKTTNGGLREYLCHFDTEDLVCYHNFWATCPRCESLNTREIEVTHPSSGVEVVRQCHNCGKQWMTKVFSDEIDDDDEPTPTYTAARGVLAPAPEPAEVSIRRLRDANDCIDPDGHFWEELWDDGERDCRVCVYCGKERIFEHDELKTRYGDEADVADHLETLTPDDDEPYNNYHDLY